jgi:hypothetical protein
MIETGTPSSQATPYFISHSLQTILLGDSATSIPKASASPLLLATAEVVMRAFNHHIGSPSMALFTESVDVGTALKQAMARLRKRFRHVLCTVTNGGHELYRAHSETKLYQQCLLCGYETAGWTIDRRDRRLHLVSGSRSTAAARR